MAVKIVQAVTKKEIKAFINFEWTINQNLAHWVSPLRMARRDILNTKKNPFYRHAEIALFLAYKDNVLSGRIAAITNQNHNDFHKDNVGFWGFFECIDDQETANSLFNAVSEWLRSKGKDSMLGPMNPSTNDEAGLLIDGFDTPPYLMMTHNHPYYQRLAEGYGNTKAKDLFAWLITTKAAHENTTEKMRRVSAKVLKRHDITMRTLQKKNLKKEIKIVKDIYNNAWSDNWGFVPFTDAEIDNVAEELKPIADENLLFIAEKAGEPIAFSVTIPNVNEVFAKIPNGKLLPGGIFKLLFGLKKIKTLRVIILGVKREYEHLGLGSIFYMESIKKALEGGYKAAEMSWILEDNYPMNNAIRNIGSDKYKTYRIYQYPL